MERPQYNCCLRQTAATGVLQQEASTTRVQDRPKESDGSSGSRTAQYIINPERQDSSSSSSKPAARQENALPRPRSINTAPPSVYPRQAGPAVQTNNRLTEDYSRKVHCYISQMENDDAGSGDQMPPPVLPSLEPPSTTQEIPFWRPPRVLQREPHYNRPGRSPASDTVLCAAQSLHSQLPQKQQVAVGSVTFLERRPSKSPHAKTTGMPNSIAQPYSQDIAAGSSSMTPTSSLSPALLAISNSHYKQQQRQEQGHALRS
ncbi:hypothetical protein H4R20_006334, partial [Coemansia guatemalensis]